MELLVPKRAEIAAPESRWALERLAAEQSVGCLLGASGEILLVNRAWDRFAIQAGARASCGEHVLGKNYFNFIEGLGPRNFFETLWVRVVRGAGASVQSECNTPSRVRELWSYFTPVRLGQVYGAVVVHAIARELPVSATRELCRPDNERYLDERGALTACSSCRRVRRRDGSGWDFVPAYLEDPPDATYGYCMRCREYLRAACPILGEEA